VCSSPLIYIYIYIYRWILPHMDTMDDFKRWENKKVK